MKISKKQKGGQPKMIDFNLQSIPEWIAQGFKLKKGGKLENNS